MLFVAPGAAFEFTFALRRPNRQRTVLQELAGVIAVSVVTSGVVVVVGLLALPDDWFAALRTTALQPSVASQEALVGLAAVVGGSVLAACALAVFAAMLATQDAPARIFNEPIWFLLFGRRPPVTVPYVVARLNNGNRYYGTVIAYTTAQVLQGERDVVLGPPLYTRWAGADHAVPVDGFGRISLSGDAIESLSVSYYPEGALG